MRNLTAKFIIGCCSSSRLPIHVRTDVMITYTRGREGKKAVGWEWGKPRLNISSAKVEFEVSAELGISDGTIV